MVYRIEAVYWLQYRCFEECALQDYVHEVFQVYSTMVR